MPPLGGILLLGRHAHAQEGCRCRWYAPCSLHQWLPSDLGASLGEQPQTFAAISCLKGPSIMPGSFSSWKVIGCKILCKGVARTTFGELQPLKGVQFPFELLLGRPHPSKREGGRRYAHRNSALDSAGVCPVGSPASLARQLTARQGRV